MPKAYDLVGQKFTRLTVLERIQIKARKVQWRCKCECGREHLTITHNLMAELCRSCGCLELDLKTSHGDHKTKFYRVWIEMVRRCTNSQRKNYNNYGGRGISVCEDWLNYKNFKRDMFEGYQEGLTIDRIDNNGNYKKENCRWVTMHVQSRNQRRNHIVQTPQGTMVLEDAAAQIGMSGPGLAYRLNQGMSENLLFNPPRSRKHTI